MSKYNTLWEYVSKCEKDRLTMTFEEIEEVAGAPLDHSFLQYKEELLKYGYAVEQISMKKKIVIFSRKRTDLC